MWTMDYYSTNAVKSWREQAYKKISHKIYHKKYTTKNIPHKIYTKKYTTKNIPQNLYTKNIKQKI